MICNDAHIPVLYVEPEDDDIAVLNNIFLSFRTYESLFPAGIHAALLDESIIGYDFGANETALKIRVDLAGSTGSLCTFCDSPCTDFIGACGQEADEPKQGIAFLNELIKAALPDAKLFDECVLFVFRELGKLLLDLCAMVSAPAPSFAACS